MSSTVRALVSVLALGVVGASWSSLPGAASAQTKEPLKVPMMESFSGAAGAWGTDMFTGAVVAAEMINKAGGVKGRPIEFYKADAPYDDVPTAVTMFRKLARDPNVPVVFDGGATTVIVAVHDLAVEFNVPLYAFSSGGHWRLPRCAPWLLGAMALAEKALPLIIPKAKDKFWDRKAARVYAHDDEAEVTNGRVLKKVAQDNGIQVIELTVKGKETDFSAPLTKIKSENVDAF